MKKIVILLSLIVVILTSGAIYLSVDKGFIKSNTNTTPIPTQIMIKDPSTGGLGKEVMENEKIKADGVSMGEIKTLIIESSNFKFEPDFFISGFAKSGEKTFLNSSRLTNFALGSWEAKPTKYASSSFTLKESPIISALIWSKD